MWRLAFEFITPGTGQDSLIWDLVNTYTMDGRISWSKGDAELL